MRRGGAIGKVSRAVSSRMNNIAPSKVNKTVKSPFREEGEGYKEFKIDLRNFEDIGYSRIAGTGNVVDGVDYYMLSYTRTFGKPPINKDARISVFWGDGTVWHVGRDDKVWKNRFDAEDYTQLFLSLGYPEAAAKARIIEGWDEWDRRPSDLLSLYHKYPSSGEYTIKILGDKEFVDSISFAPGFVQSTNYTSPISGDTIYEYAVKTSSSNQGSVLTDIIAGDFNKESASSFRSVNAGNLGTKGVNWIKNKMSSGEWYHENLEGEKVLIKLQFMENVDVFANEIENIDLSEIDSVNSFFLGSDIGSTIDISGWDVSNVKDIQKLFQNCAYVGKSQDLSSWDTSNVITMNNFATYSSIDGEAGPFTSTSISSWNLNSLENCSNMFSNHRESNGGLTDTECQTILKGWADNSNTASNVNATGVFGYGGETGSNPRVYSTGSDMDSAITTLTNKGWTITKITIE